MKNNFLKISFVIVILSFFIHLYLATTHYAFKYGAEAGKSICSVTEKLNCEAVSISPYSYFLNIPMATWGLMFHIVFLILFFFLVKEGQKERTTRFIFLMALVSATASLVMGLIAFTQMSTYCLFCIILYVLSFANLGILLLFAERPLFILAEDLPFLFRSGEQGFRNFLICIILFAPATFLADDILKKNYSIIPSFMIEEGISTWERSSSQQFTKPILVKGDPLTAKFKIVEFADFMCPHCAHAVHTLDSFMNSHKDVSVEFFVFPLDSQCNPAIGSGNGQRCTLAKAVFCAEKQSKGWSAHNWIFEKIGIPEQMDLNLLKSSLNINAESFDICMSSEEASKAIFESAKMGQDAKVEGTPSVFVNNKKLGLGNTIPVLENLYKKIVK